MAVQDKYIDTNVAAGKKGNAGKVSGGKLLAIACTFDVAAADSDTSVYRLGRLPANAIPIRCEIYADSALGTSAFCLGLHKPGVGGAVVDKDLFFTATDLTAGVAITAGANNGLKAIAIEDIGQKIYELLDKTAATKTREDYDLTITADTAGGAEGTISVIFLYILG